MPSASRTPSRQLPRRILAQVSRTVEACASASIAAILSSMKSRAAAGPLAAGWLLKRARELAEPVAALVSPRAEAVRGVPPRRLRARTGAPGAREFADGGRQ